MADTAIDNGRRLAAPVSPKIQGHSGTASPRFPRQTLDDLEYKMMRHLEKAQQRNDQGKEMLRTWAEAKMANVSSLQTKCDLRIAELSGNYAALSDELQLQVRRSELCDQNLWQWRRHLEEEFRSKLVETDIAVSELSSSTRSSVAAVEEAVNRNTRQLRSLETIVAERLRSNVAQELLEETLQRIELLEERSELSESSKALLLAVGTGDNGAGEPATLDREVVSDLERQLAEVNRVLLQLQQTSSETGRRLEVHEERMKTIRTIVDQLRDTVMTLTGKLEVPGDLEVQMTKAIRRLDETRTRLDPRLEQLDTFQRWMTEMQEALEKLQQNQTLASAAYPASRAQNVVREVLRVPESDVQAGDVTVDAQQETVTDLTRRVRVLEANSRRWAEQEAEAMIARLTRVEELAQRQEAHTSESSEISERLLQLIRQLGELAPKVEEHEVRLRDIQTAVAIDRHSGSASALQGVDDGVLKGRIGACEEQLTLLSTNVANIATDVVASQQSTLSAVSGKMDAVSDRVVACEDQLAGLSTEVSKVFTEVVAIRQRFLPEVAGPSLVGDKAASVMEDGIVGGQRRESRDLQTLAAKMERSSQDTIGALDELATRLQVYDGAFAGLLQKLESDTVATTEAAPAPRRSLVRQVTTSVINRAVSKEAEERAKAVAVNAPLRRRGTGELQEELKWVISLQEELDSSSTSIAKEARTEDTRQADERPPPDTRVITQALMHQVYRRGLAESSQRSS